MALIDLTAEIKGSSQANAMPTRIIEVTAVLSGRSAGNLQRAPQAPPPPQVKKSDA